MSGQPTPAQDLLKDPGNAAVPPLRPPGPRPAPPQTQGPPRPFLPGGPVTPRAPLPRPSGPNSIQPQAFRGPAPPPAAQQPRPQGVPPQVVNSGPPLQQGQQQPNPRPQQINPGPHPPSPGPPPQQQQYPGQAPQGQPGPRGPPRNPTPPHLNSSLDKPNSASQPRPPAPPLGQVSRQGSSASLNPPQDLVDNQRRGPMDPEPVPPAAKNRSYSIAVPPSAPGPIHDEERRRSISTVGARPEEPVARGPGLAFIKEGVPSYDKKESPLNIGLTRLSKEDINKGSRESVKSDGSDTKPDRPESRLSGSKMTESIIGSLDTDERKMATSKISPSPNGLKGDDELHRDRYANSGSPAQNVNKSPSPNLSQYNGHVPSSPAPSLTRTDSSPDQKMTPNKDSPNRPSSVSSNLSKTPEPVTVIGEKPSGRPPSVQSNKSDHRVDTPDIKQSASPDPASGRPVSRAGVKPTDFATPIKSDTGEEKKVVRKPMQSAQKSRKEGDNDSGVDESTQGNEHVNGSPGSPGKKSPSKIPGIKSQNSGHNLNSAGPRVARSPSGKNVGAPHTPNTPDSTTSNTSIDKKKVPVNKIQVGAAPSPNIKTAKSKIGSLQNATHKPGGGKIKIENRKLDFNNVTPRIAAKNDTYHPGGGDKKITQKKLQWNAKSKIGSLENATHKPGGGDKKIETVKLDFKDKAKPKVASTVNITHKPGGGDVKCTNTKDGKKDIENQKLDIKAHSKVGSLDNVKHKPGGGDVKIFDDKEYLKQVAAATSDSVHTPISESPVPTSDHPPISDENLNRES